ncbi:MAG: 50S ribosomal protein L22 [Chloroflexi bacterium]|jgi:large subunit ribosomal protein L22|nr:50S ribosomal protein L22 [Chloroflexota bacterium]MCK4843514.1 50S ribosomal protein L22 [Dehalococcoidia bacterium]TET55755.1 MAG: 50S ribosomal protein L22 [Dehalococcoidia bacterium]
MKVRAMAEDVGISPQKVRLTINMVRGKKVDEALRILSFLPTPTAKAVAKVVRSAAANAENSFQMSPAELRITDIFADQGHTLKRFRPQSRGRASPILKRSSRITVFVAEREE